MKETIKKSSEDFPLQKNVPLSPSEVVQKIGDYSRKVMAELKNTSDFPQKVKVIRKNGTTVETTLTNIFTDDGSQSDGTFYFSDNVREDSDSAKRNYFFGSEIESIIFLE